MSVPYDTVAAASQVRAKTAGPSHAMPDLRGLTVEAAQEKIDAFFDGSPGVERWRNDLDVLDYSAENRYDADDSWVTLSTYPIAGQNIGDEETELHVFALRKREIAWFRQHPRMPKIPAGVPFAQLVRPAGVLGPVRQLIEQRYPKGYAGGGGTRDSLTLSSYDRVWAEDPRIEPTAWRIQRDRLKEPYSTYDKVTTGASLPGQGTKLTMGRVLTVLVNDKPEPPPEESSGSGDSYYFGYDDDDFNVPGWLCPTRFC